MLRGRFKANIECLDFFIGFWTDGHLAKSSNSFPEEGATGHFWNIDIQNMLNKITSN